MQEREVKIVTKEGRMRAFVAQPDGPGPFPAVIHFFYIGGLNDTTKYLARRVAEDGYCCIVPDLYYRAGEVVLDMSLNDPMANTVRATVRAIVGQYDRVNADVEATLDFLDKDEFVKKGPRGTIGYCLGGIFGVVAGGAFPERIKATAVLHGTALYSDQPEAPYPWTKTMAGEFYCGIAEHEHSMPAPAVELFTKYVEENCKAKYDLEIHPGAKHGFAMPGNSYLRKASDRAWDKVFDMYGRVLKG